MGDDAWHVTNTNGLHTLTATEGSKVTLVAGKDSSAGEVVYLKLWVLEDRGGVAWVEVAIVVQCISLGPGPPPDRIP
jgi:hypothetical protein